MITSDSAVVIWMCASVSQKRLSFESDMSLCQLKSVSLILRVTGETYSPNKPSDQYGLPLGQRGREMIDCTMPHRRMGVSAPTAAVRPQRQVWLMPQSGPMARALPTCNKLIVS